MPELLRWSSRLTERQHLQSTRGEQHIGLYVTRAAGCNCWDRCMELPEPERTVEECPRDSFRQQHGFQAFRVHSELCSSFG